MGNGGICTLEKTSLKHVVQDGNGKVIKVRSKLETDLAYILSDLKVPWTYETTKLSYTIPESLHTYTVDFSIPNKGILIEGKGYLSDHKERSKYILIKEQYPELDLRFVFMDCNKLCGGAKYSHGTWATKQGFKYCSIKDYNIIKDWLSESIN